MSRASRTSRLLVLALAVAAPVALVSACGEEQSTTTAVSATGGATETTDAPGTTAPPTTGADGAEDGGTGSAPEAAEQPTTTVDPEVGVGQAEARVRDAVAAWSDSLTGVAVSPGEELIVSISTDDEALPALEVCEAARGALVGIDGAAGATVNVWLTPDLSAEGGDERVLAGSLGGAECELLRSPE